LKREKNDSARVENRELLKILHKYNENVILK
jgi:hypothetical protein